MSIEFTHITHSKGKNTQHFIDRSEAIEDLANELVSLGYEFIMEDLTNGVIKLAVRRDKHDFVHALFRNGPEITKSIDKLVKRAAKELL